MSNVNSACLKICRDAAVIDVKIFTFSSDRETWLLNHGFLPSSNNIYVHIDGRIAGKFATENAEQLLKSKRLDEIPAYRKCTTPITSKTSMWNTLLGVK